MRFPALLADCALLGCLLQAAPTLAEPLRTAWLGEHEAFLVWYAREKGCTLTGAEDLEIRHLNVLKGV